MSKLGNRRIGEFLKELDLTEGRSTGVPKILRAMAANGSPPPESESDDDRSYFLIRLPVHPQAEGWLPDLTPQVTPQVERLLAVSDGELLREELQVRLGITNRKYLRTGFLLPAIQAGLLEMTIPDKPNSSKQRYRLTALGRSLRASQAFRNWSNPEEPRA